MSKNISQKINTIPIIGEPVCLSTDAKVERGADITKHVRMEKI